MFRQIMLGIFLCGIFQIPTNAFAKKECSWVLNPLPDPPASSELIRGAVDFLALNSVGELQLQTLGFSQARMKLFEVMGTSEVVELFGPDFNAWPFYLGTSKGGHIITGILIHNMLYIQSYKRLPMSQPEFLARRELDFKVAVEGKVPPEGYESLKSFIERTEGDFNLTKRNILNSTKLSLLNEYYEHQILNTVQTRGALGALKYPWIRRQTAVLVPVDGEKAFDPGTTQDYITVVNAFLAAP